MANSTWNFACDWRAGASAGGSGFGAGNVGSDATTDPETQPFSSAITVVFAFQIRTGTDPSGQPQALFSIADGAAYADLGAYTVANIADSHRFLIDLRHRGPGVGSETSDIRVLIKDRSGVGSMHYDAIFGDTDGTNWLQENKWYQMAISAGGTAVHVYINGVTTMQKTVTANVMGDLNLKTNPANNRFWLNSCTSGQFIWPPNSSGQGDFGHRSFLTGPVMIDDRYFDLSNATIRGRIFDGNGDLKNAGKNGSLWLGDTYDETVPLMYFPNGWVHREFGRGGYTWKEAGNNFDAGEWAGNRKDYE